MSTTIEKRKQRGFLKNAVLLIPDFLRLLLRLMRDARVPAAEKAMVIGTIVYVISPLDLLPDFVPFLGQVDDIYLVSLVILRLLARTPSEVMTEHWEGRGNLPKVVDKILKAAKYILPSKIRHILLGRVEIGSKSKGVLLSSPAEPESIESRRKSKG